LLRIEEVLYGRKGVRLRAEHLPYLEKVEDEATQFGAQRARLASAIRAAHEADVPFRAIAAAAGISHEQARRMVKATQR
jgi:hypothetical protein